MKQKARIVLQIPSEGLRPASSSERIIFATGRTLWLTSTPEEQRFAIDMISDPDLVSPSQRVSRLSDSSFNILMTGRPGICPVCRHYPDCPTADEDLDNCTNPTLRFVAISRVALKNRNI